MFILVAFSVMVNDNQLVDYFVISELLSVLNSFLLRELNNWR